MTTANQKALANILRFAVTLAITMGLGLILRILMPRLLGVENMGYFYTAESLAVITFTFLSLGMHAFINRNFPGNAAEATRVMRTMVGFELVYGMLLAVGLYTYLIVNDHSERALTQTMIFAVSQFCLVLAGNILKPSLIALEEVKLVNLIDVSAKLIQVGGVAAILIWKMDLTWVMIAYAVTSLIGLSLYLAALYHRGWLSGAMRFGVIGEVLAISLPFFINSALVTLYGNVDIAILSNISTTSEVGLYGAAQKLKGILLLVVPLISSGVIPILSRLYKEDQAAYQTMLQDTYRALMAFCLPTAAAMVMFSDWAISFLYGKEFIDSVPILSLLAPVTVFTYINVFLAMNLSLCSSGKGLTSVTFVSMLVNAGLNFVLIPWGIERFGVGGGGIAATMTTIIAECGAYFALIAITPITLMSRGNIKATLLVAIPLVVLIIFSHEIHQVSIWLRLAAYVLICPLFLLVTGMLRRSDLMAIKDLLSKRVKR